MEKQDKDFIKHLYNKAFLSALGEFVDDVERQIAFIEERDAGKTE